MSATDGENRGRAGTRWREHEKATNSAEAESAQVTAVMERKRIVEHTRFMFRMPR